MQLDFSICLSEQNLSSETKFIQSICFSKHHTSEEVKLGKNCFSLGSHLILEFMHITKSLEALHILLKFHHYIIPYLIFQCPFMTIHLPMVLMTIKIEGIPNPFHLGLALHMPNFETTSHVYLLHEGMQQLECGGDVGPYNLHIL